MDPSVDDMNRRAVTGRHSPEQILTTRVGLQFPSKLTFEQWAEAGRRLSGLVSSFAWCLGDWLIYGKENYNNRYLEAIERIGLDYQTLRNYAWVTRRFPASRRRESLSFQHHAEVASLPPAEQDAWLDRAEQRGWSKSQLRQQVRRARDAHESTGATALMLPRLRLEEDRLATWHVAAARTGSDLANWIVTTLDREAARTLGDRAAE